MKIADQLTKKQKQQLRESAKTEEKVDWKEIMGMNRDTYKRHNGAIRRK